MFYSFFTLNLTDILRKELRVCHKLYFSNPYIYAIEYYIMYRLKNLTTLGCKDTGIYKLEFVTKTQFFCPDSLIYPIKTKLYKCLIFLSMLKEKKD